MTDHYFEVAQKLEAQLAEARERIAELEASESEAITRAGAIIGARLDVAKQLEAANAAVRDAGALFERMARDGARRHLSRQIARSLSSPPDDSDVAPETWKLVCEWQARPEVMAAMNLDARPATAPSKRYGYGGDGLPDVELEPDAPAPTVPRHVVEVFAPTAEDLDEDEPAPTRTEAEQRVLDAMRVAAIAVYRDGKRRFLHDDQEQAVCEAELARRWPEAP